MLSIFFPLLFTRSMSLINGNTVESSSGVLLIIFMASTLKFMLALLLLKKSLITLAVVISLVESNEGVPFVKYTMCNLNVSLSSLSCHHICIAI